MAKIVAFFFIALFLSSMLAHATRSAPVFNEELPAKAQHLGVGDAEHDETVVVDSCEGVSKDECLMRRTLDAHVDYIYTQGHKHKP